MTHADTAPQRPAEPTGWPSPRALAAYEQGRADQHAHDRAHLADLLADLAARHADLAAAWQRLGAVTRQQRITRDLVAMHALSDRLAAELGRPAGYTYRGGPVDWDTGKPLTTPWRADRMRAA